MAVSRSKDERREQIEYNCSEYLVRASFDYVRGEVRNLFEVRVFAPHGLRNLNKYKRT